MSKVTAATLVVLSTLFWGINFHAGKYVVQSMSPFDGAGIRFLIASVVVLLMLLAKERLITIWDDFKQQWIIYTILGLIGIGGFNGLFFLGLEYTSAVNGSLIMATNPLITVLFSAVILKEPIYRKQYFGMALSLIGVILVITQGKWDLIRHFQISLGDGIIMGANVCFALYSVLSRAYLKKNNPLMTTAMTMIIGAISLLLCAYFIPSPYSWGHQSLAVYAALFHMGFFGTVLAYLFWNSGIVTLGVNQTVIFFNLTPVFVVLIALLLGHPISLEQLLGGSLVLIGVALSKQ